MKRKPGLTERPTLTEEQRDEIIRCYRDPIYFIEKYCRIEDPQEGRGWFPFILWPEQKEVVRTILDNQKTVILKARQLGLSWLLIALILWIMLFWPGSSMAIMSRRETEATYLLRDRLKAMYDRLPEWMQSPWIVANDTEFRLANGSVARAFATGTGDSYTNTFVLIDEADIGPQLEKGMKALEPTIDAGGKIALLSRVDKAKPASFFKRIYRGAKGLANGWAAVFLPWWVRPSRTQAWYDSICAAAMSSSGSLDTVHEQYPETDAQALQGATQNKRFVPTIVEACFAEQRPLGIDVVLGHARKLFESLGKNAPEEKRIDIGISGLEVYRLPEPKRAYVIGVDPAEGNPKSDDSALTVLDAETWEEVAALAGKIEPEVLGDYINRIGRFFNEADVLCERNNHGHTVILWMKEHSELRMIRGEDGKRGWMTTEKSKTLMCNSFATALSEKTITIHTTETHLQVCSIEGTTLKAPEGEHDDRAISILLAHQAAKKAARSGF